MSAETQTSFSDRRQIGFGYVAYQESGSFYKLAAGVLMQVPMLVSGAPDMTDEGDLNAVPVDWDYVNSGIDAELAADCRRIVSELESNDVQGDDYWNGVKLPDFVKAMIEAGKIKPVFRVSENVADFAFKSHAGANFEFFVQPVNDDRQEPQYLNHIVFINTDEDIDGKYSTEFARELDAAAYLDELLNGDSVKIYDRQEFYAALDEAAEPIRVSEDAFFDARGAVPPVSGKGCWAMGEIANHTSDGEEVYYWFTSRNNLQYYGFKGTQEAAETAFAKIPR